MTDRILIIGELGSEVQAFADALAQDSTLSLAPTVLDAGKRLQKESYAAIIFDAPEGGAQTADILRRYAAESALGNFGLYVGNETAGRVHPLPREA